MIKILVAGDFCPRDRVQELVENQEFEKIFGDVVKYTSKADYSIVNLEAPVVESVASPIDKCGPNLKCSSKAVKAIKYAGFNMVTLANNHFYDYGDAGVKDTLQSCIKENIDYVGGGSNIDEAAKILYKEIKGVTFAFINCCEREFSIATKNTGGSNPINPIKQFYAISEAKNNADKIIVIVHGGHEHYQLPSPRMKELYRFYIDAGADVVINHHQHCYSGYEIYKEKPIFYGLGNFCFDRNTKRNSIWNEGYAVMLFIDDKLEFRLLPYIQGNDKPGVEFVQDIAAFEDNINRLNNIINDDSLLEENHKKYMNSTSKQYLFPLEPYYNRIAAALYRRGLLPSTLVNKRRYNLLNYLLCESHAERLINALLSLNK